MTILSNNYAVTTAHIYILNHRFFQHNRAMENCFLDYIQFEHLFSWNNNPIPSLHYLGFCADLLLED